MAATVRSIYMVLGLASLTFNWLPPYSLAQESTPTKHAGTLAHQTMGRAEFESDNLNAWPSQLTDDARHMAEQLGLMPLINEYLQLKNQTPPAERANTPRLQSLRQDITDLILTTMLEVQSVNAKINLEIAQCDDVRNLLEDKRDKAIRYNAIANIVAGAVSNVIGVGLQIPTNKNWSELPGETVELVGGASQTGLGMLALKQQDGSKHGLQAKPNMLAKLFDRQITPQADFPPSLWAYLNSPVEGSNLSKRAQLIQGWKMVGLLPDARKAGYNRQIDLLTATASNHYSVSIDLLQDRASMLAGLRALLTQMDSNLLELMLFMRR